MRSAASPDALSHFHPVVQGWFRSRFPAPTAAQRRAWPAVASGGSALLLAPTGSGKTLSAFLFALDRLMFAPPPAPLEALRVLYVSPLKALGVYIERNLQEPLSGFAGAGARSGVPHRIPSVAIRSGDTPANERRRLLRHPPEVLITTPESLYLLLTSSARRSLATVQTVIIDEIHALGATKRGAHLFVSLERLEALRRQAATADRAVPPLQRIGLSATQRPLQGMAELLGGGELGSEGTWTPRPVRILDASEPRPLEIRVEVPVADMSAPDPQVSEGPAPASIWPSIHRRILELVRKHRTTLIFVNSRRLAERLAQALNDLAGSEVASAHHGSLARERREQLEQQLKAGSLPALVATSSLELGIDMGAIELVVQVEAPTSLASALQRIGRSGHQVGGLRRGVILPKHRGELLPCAAAVPKLREGWVEATRFPQNPLDVAAQQIVAEVAMGECAAGDLFDLLRRAAPFRSLPRESFDGLLDLLSGRYPSDEFSGLKPRITWDRIGQRLRARPGAQRLAIAGAGTIVDRGLYGVYLAGAERPVRVGELDEEMVFESKPGDVFLLGASSWRIEDITHDRVLVSPAPGQPGKTPFWRGERAGRPWEFGAAIGALTRRLASLPEADARALLTSEHALDRYAADNTLALLRAELAASGALPTDRAIVVERFQDELGDTRVCLLSPFGSRVHAAWAMAIRSRVAERLPKPPELVWSDDGIVVRLPELDRPAPLDLFVFGEDEVEALITRGVFGTALFAGRFRENAARALLLPRRALGRRTPLWAQRKRAADLLAVAARFPSFPILLETHRECQTEVLDVDGLKRLLRAIEREELRVVEVSLRTPSPMAASLLFSYVSHFIYDADTPLLERRAQALSVDQDQLQQLLGKTDFRKLLSSTALTELEAQLQKTDRVLEGPDAVHDLLLSIGDLSELELRERTSDAAALTAWLAELEKERRVLSVEVAGTPRFIASEDAAKFRDAIGVRLPKGLPRALLERAPNGLVDLVARFARTHGPFATEDVARRLGLPPARCESVLKELQGAGRVLSGEFRPGGEGPEWCDAGVLRALRARSLARLRRQIEPVAPPTFARFLLEWHEVGKSLSGTEGVLASVEQLQGAELPASVVESDVLPARVADYQPGTLDLLCASGEVVWRATQPLGTNDARIALYLRDDYPLLAPPTGVADGELAARLREALAARGASFFPDLVQAVGGFAPEIAEALWQLVFAGEVSNDTLAPLRSRAKPEEPRGRAARQRPRARSRALPGTEGRFWLLPKVDASDRAQATRRTLSTVETLLARHGIVSRKTLALDPIPGGFSAVYPLLRDLEARGRVRRGYFVKGLGGAQFAYPGADERLRAVDRRKPDGACALLAATDPANPYGAALPWPEGVRGQRAAGALVVLFDGELVAFVSSDEGRVTTCLPDEEPRRAAAALAVARQLAERAELPGRRAVLIREVDGQSPDGSLLGAALRAVGFSTGVQGALKRRSPPASSSGG